MDHCVSMNAYASRRLAKQATEGANKEERPMWAEKGGIDFDGRSRCHQSCCECCCQFW